MNINIYTGKQYDFRRYNCWHHVIKVRGDAGIDTPKFDVVRPCDAARMFASGQGVDSKGLVMASVPRDYDAVLMGYLHGGRVVWHSGVYYGGYVSHCERAAKQVKLEALSDLIKRYPRMQFWR
ncbi:MAG: hypothetical protein [Bacteriophage sp.]|nr:MAG: hypothetical protein [Bacteriophage sp.]